MTLKDTDAIVKRLEEFYCKNCNNYNGVKCRACEMDDALSAIDDAPTIDAVPVVRCKDCKRHSTGYCRLGHVNDGQNWFCADGERRENNETD